ncbi:MAG TPA: hypothetical protein VLB09_09765, partial [Nitrospiria bacterium]|nr:hypothetical protein [Nitrospiria bacterium]
RFRVSDPDFKGPPGAFRLREVREAISRGLVKGDIPAPLPSPGGYRAGGRIFPKTRPIRVEVDNDTSDRYTVVEVFAPDRAGVLAVMAQALFKEHMSVQAARVATQLDQVVDVFHVTDRAGQRIVDPDKIRAFTAALTDQIENFLAADPVPSGSPSASPSESNDGSG